MNFHYSIKELENIKKENINVLSCFSGGGGSSLGYKLNGYNVIGNIEIDKKQNDIYVRNLKPQYNFNCDIRDVVVLAKDRKLDPIFYNLDILDGSPPCSTFSSCGLREKSWGEEKIFREGQKKQILDELFFVFIDLLDTLKPKIVIGENVLGIIQGSAKTNYADKILSEYERVGYHSFNIVLNSQNMKVPQARKRVFFIGIRKDICCNEEVKNIKNKLEKLKENEILFQEVVNTLKDKNIVYSPLVKIKEDSLQLKLWNNKEKGETNLSRSHLRLFGTKKHFGRVIIQYNKIFPTLVSGNTYLYEDKPYNVAIEELISVSTFPYDFDFINKSLDNVKYVCGMSVPPFMIKEISKILVTLIK